MSISTMYRGEDEREVESQVVVGMRKKGADEADLIRVLSMNYIKTSRETLRVIGPNFRLRHADSVHAAQTLLKDGVHNYPFDIVLAHYVMSNALEHVQVSEMLIDMFKKGRLKAVVVTYTMDRDAARMLECLRSAGVPCGWFPHDYSEPSKHVLKAPPSFPRGN